MISDFGSSVKKILENSKKSIPITDGFTVKYAAPELLRLPNFI